MLPQQQQKKRITQTANIGLTQTDSKNNKSMFMKTGWLLFS